MYSPSLKSPSNAPKGCSSLQLEVYCKEGEYTESQLLDGTVGKLCKLDIIKQIMTPLRVKRPSSIVFTS